MRCDRKAWLCSLLAAGLVAGIAPDPCAAKQWEAGDALPALPAAALEGDVPAFQGKVLLIDFWASWCGPCKRSFPVLEQLHRKYGKQGLVVLGVNVGETGETMKKFLDTHPVTFPVVRDREQQVVGSAGIVAMPSSVLVDRRGTIRFVHRGFKGLTNLPELEQEIERFLGEQ